MGVDRFNTQFSARVARFLRPLKPTSTTPDHTFTTQSLSSCHQSDSQDDCMSPLPCDISWRIEKTHVHLASPLARRQTVSVDFIANWPLRHRRTRSLSRQANPHQEMSAKALPRRT